MTTEEPASSEGRDLGERVGAVVGQPLQGDPVRAGEAPAPIGSALTSEPELRALLRDLHDQLLRRDEEIERLAHLVDARGPAPPRDEELLPLLTRQASLAAMVDERTAWAERMAEEAKRRAEVIQELRAALDEQRGEAERRAEVIEELQAALDERTAWAERMVGEAERRLADNRELHRQLASARQTIAEMQAHPVWCLATQLGRMRSLPRRVRRLGP